MASYSKLARASKAPPPPQGRIGLKINIYFQFVSFICPFTSRKVKRQVFRFKANGEDVYFYVIFVDPLKFILSPPFINLSNFTRYYQHVHKYIIDG